MYNDVIVHRSNILNKIVQFEGYAYLIVYIGQNIQIGENLTSITLIIYVCVCAQITLLGHKCELVTGRM